MKAMATSDVLDANENAAVCFVQMQLLGLRRTIAGRIRTIQCFEDNALVKAVVAEASEGEVLVIDGGGSLKTALMGDMIAAEASRNGWAGAVVIGAVRDSEAIGKMDFHVKCLGTIPRKSTKKGTGARDVAIEFGGVQFVPGKFLYSDADGIVVVQQAAASWDKS